MTPFRFRFNGSAPKTEDRVELEAHLRESFGIPTEQAIEFIEDSVNEPISEAELRLLKESRGGVGDDEEEED